MTSESKQRAGGRSKAGWRKPLRLFATAVLGLSAIVQLNDPDPWAWVAIYGAGALISGLFPRFPRARAMALCVAIIASGWMLSLAPSALQGFEFGQLVQAMKAETPSIELGRELLGLGIVVGWMICLVLLYVPGERRLEVPGEKRLERR